MVGAWIADPGRAFRLRRAGVTAGYCMPAVPWRRATRQRRERRALMAIDNTQIHPGMQVVGANGQNIGSIKEVRGGEFLVNRRMHRDVWVPFSAVVSVVENDVTLNVV